MPSPIEPLESHLIVNEMLSDYLGIKAGDSQFLTQMAELCRQILNDWQATKAGLVETNKTLSNLFNPLHTIIIGETTHSALIGNLLNPQGSHGQGSLFLHSFLSLIGVPDPANGKWRVTVETGRIDILLRREKPCSVVVIENKSNDADDQSNQLYRYWHSYIYPKIKTAPEALRKYFKVVYLAPTASKEPLGDSLFRPVNWALIDELPERVPGEYFLIVTLGKLMQHWATDPNARISDMNIRLATFLNFYAELWETP